jgi:hypothetical protein
MVCAFFGHRDAPTAISPAISRMIEMLILEKGIDVFYVGHQGKFDKMVCRALCRAKVKYPHVDCVVVLAYPPKKGEKWELETLYPFGLERAPRVYAILARNAWMVERADFVVSYVTRQFGGAAKAVSLAKRKGCEIFSLPCEM